MVSRSQEYISVSPTKVSPSNQVSDCETEDRLYTDLD